MNIFNPDFLDSENFDFNETDSFTYSSDLSDDTDFSTSSSDLSSETDSFTSSSELGDSDFEEIEPFTDKTNVKEIFDLYEFSPIGETNDNSFPDINCENIEEPPSTPSLSYEKQIISVVSEEAMDVNQSEFGIIGEKIDSFILDFEKIEPSSSSTKQLDLAQVKGQYLDAILEDFSTRLSSFSIWAVGEDPNKPNRKFGFGIPGFLKGKGKAKAQPESDEESQEEITLESAGDSADTFPVPPNRLFALYPGDHGAGPSIPPNANSVITPNNIPNSDTTLDTQGLVPYSGAGNLVNTGSANLLQQNGLFGIQNGRVSQLIQAQEEQNRALRTQLEIQEGYRRGLERARGNTILNSAVANSDQAQIQGQQQVEERGSDKSSESKKNKVLRSLSALAVALVSAVFLIPRLEAGVRDVTRTINGVGPYRAGQLQGRQEFQTNLQDANRSWPRKFPFYRGGQYIIPELTSASGSGVNRLKHKKHPEFQRGLSDGYRQALDEYRSQHNRHLTAAIRSIPGQAISAQEQLDLLSENGPIQIALALFLGGIFNRIVKQRFSNEKKKKKRD